MRYPLGRQCQMLGRKQLVATQGGVYAPEGILEPKPLIDMMRERGLVAYRDLALTKPLE